MNEGDVAGRNSAPQLSSIQGGDAGIVEGETLGDLSSPERDTKDSSEQQLLASKKEHVESPLKNLAERHHVNSETPAEDSHAVKETVSSGVMRMSPRREDEGGGIKRQKHGEGLVVTETAGEENWNGKMDGSNGVIGDAKVQLKSPKLEIPAMEGDFSSRSDQGSARVTSQGDEDAYQGVKQTRRHKIEVKDSSGGMETPLRHRLDRSAKGKGDMPTKPTREGINDSQKGEVESLATKQVKTGKVTGTQSVTGMHEVDDEVEAIGALAAVMEVHRIRKEAPEPLADFPGEIGVGKKNCHLCKKPETAKNSIVCDKCHRSYHLSCVKLKPKQALEIENEHWQCESCGTERGWYYWPFGRITPKHDRRKADPRRIEARSNATPVITGLTTRPETNAAGEANGVRAGLAPATVNEGSNGHKGVGTMEHSNVVREKDDQVAAHLNDMSENSGRSLKKSRGRPRKDSKASNSEVKAAAVLEPVCNGIGLGDSQSAFELRNMITSPPDLLPTTVSMPVLMPMPIPALTPMQTQAALTPTHGVTDTHIVSRAIDVETSGDAATVTMTEDDFQNHEKQKKREEELLEDLRDFIASKNGSLEKGWEIFIKRRPGNTHVCDKIFVSPNNLKFRSRVAVARFLGLLGEEKGFKKSVDASAQNAAEGLELPFHFGDLTIESFGDATAKYTNTDRSQVWPVGYQSTWHDSETGSLCTSEVMDGGQSGPVFRITRRSCMSLSKSNEFVLSTSAPQRKGAICTTESGKDGGMFPSTFQFQSESLDPPKRIVSEDKVVVTDPIGELAVEAASSAEAWEQFAKLFMVRCKASAAGIQSLGSLCPHAVNLSNSTSLRIRDPEGRADLGTGQSCLLTKLPTELMERPGDINLADEVASCRRLEERLGADRFGLNQQLVQELIANKIGGSLTDVSKINGEKVEDVALNSSVRNLRRREKRARDKEVRQAPGVSDIGKEITSMVGLNKETLPDITAPDIFEESKPEKPPVKAKKMPVVKESRALPPPGELLTKRLPGELVGDALQVWEFLCRFSDIIGLNSPLTYEELETGLVNLGPPLPVEEEPMPKEVQPSLGPSTMKVDHKYERQENTDAGPDMPGESCGAEAGQSRDPDGEGTRGALTNDLNFVEGNQVRELKGAIPSTNHETAAQPLSSDKPEQDASLMVEGGVQTETETNTGGQETRTSAEAASEELSAVERAVAFPDGTLNDSFVMIARMHIPLLKLLLADLQFRIMGTPNVSKSEEPKKKGRKPLNEAPQVVPVPEFPDDLPINEVTWPELVRRYLITLIEAEKFGDLTDLRPEERRWLIRCLQGDGGVLCGAVFTVVGVESDAQVLAEAEKELSNRMLTVEEEKKVDEPVEEDGDLNDGSDQQAKWVLALRPVAKMPTNVGARIRNKVKEALELDPPEWARETLEWSISRDVFRGNASGPTKKAVMEVLKNYDVTPSGKAPAHKAKTKRMVPPSEQLMQRCRVVLRTVADADKTEAFSILVGGPEGHGAGKLRGIVARPLDFRTIDARIAAGAYGGSVDAFAADVRQIWRNVELVQKGGELMELAASLSQLFEDLYKKQVINLMSGILEVQEEEPKKDVVAALEEGKEPVNAPLTRSATAEKPEEGRLQKAPWQDNDTCRVCGVDEDYESIMLCDKCDAEYHTYCLDPPLDKVPEGNWFCPDCVALNKGFPDKPSGQEGETVEAESLEGEDEQFLDDGARKKEVKAVMGESAAQCLLKQVEANEYWQLGLAERIQLLNFLCEEALKTTQVRVHLEKTLDIASELQQQLCTLYAEREEAVVSLGNQGRDRTKEQAQLGTTPEGSSSQVQPVIGTEDNIDPSSTRLRHTSSSAATVSPALPRLLKYDAIEGVGSGGLIPMEKDSPGKGGKVNSTNQRDGHGDHKLDENRGTAPPSNHGIVSNDTITEVPSSTALDTSLPDSDSGANAKKRKHDDVDMHKSEDMLAVGTLEEGKVSERDTSLISKRVKVEECIDDATLVMDARVSTCLEEARREDGVEKNKDMDGNSEAAFSNLESDVIPGRPEELFAGTVDGRPYTAEESFVNLALLSNGEEKLLHSSDEAHGVPTLAPSSDSTLDGVSGRGCDVGAKEVDVTLTPGAKESLVDGESTDLGAESGRRVPLRSCRKTVELASSPTGKRGDTNPAGVGLPPRTPKRKLEMNSTSETQKKLKRTIAAVPTCNGVEDRNGMPKMSKNKVVKHSPDLLETAQGTPALGEVIDVPPGDKAPSHASRQKSFRSPLTAPNLHLGTTLLNPLQKLDAEIAKVELKLYHTTLRRDHLGVDDLGRDYWVLSGSDQTPMLVVSEGDHLGRAEFERAEECTFLYVEEQSGRPRSDGGNTLDDGTGEKPKEKKTRWCAYRKEVSVEALIAWLNPRNKAEHALKTSICQWRDSVFSKPRESPEANQAEDLESLTLKPNLPRKDADGSPKKGGKPSQKPKVGSKRFPTLRATSILQTRYGSSSLADIKISGKKSVFQMEGRVTRCTCLEPLWRFRWHCHACHETYESSAELAAHETTCPDAIPIHSHFKKKQKGSVKGKKTVTPEKGKKSRTPEKGKKQTKSATPKKEGARRYAERDASQPRIYDETSWMTEDASEQPLHHRHATRSKTQTPPSVKLEMDPEGVNGDWAMQEEPMDAFFLSDFQDDLHNPAAEDTPAEDLSMGFGSFSSLLQDEEWGANLRPDRSEAKRKKQGSGKKSSKQTAVQGASEEALANFDYASIPMSFSTPDSTRDRILQIGCIADQGPTFAPALHFAPAFDPSLMIQPYFPITSETPTNTTEYPAPSPSQITPGSSPTGELLDVKDFEGGRLDAVSWYDPQSSGEIPPDAEFAPATGDMEPVLHPESGAAWDYKWDELVGLPTLESQQTFVPEVEGGCTVNAMDESVSFSEELPPPADMTLLPEFIPESFPEGLAVQDFEGSPEVPTSEVQTVAPSSVVIAKKPSKKFGAPEASLRPLVGEQFGVLRGLKMRLLDMEAAMGSDTLVSARSAPARRRAWRSLVKSAQCIYEMTKAVVILEQMVRAECLKKTWCHWSSLSAAARSVTLSSLALKIYALDAAVTYRKEKIVAEEQPRPTTVKKGKKTVQVEVPTSSKKKKLKKPAE